MSQNIYGSQEKELSLIEEAFELLQNADIDVSLEDVKNLLQFSPHVKELFVKATELSHNSGQNVFDVIKKVISVYEEELKRDDLTFEQRTAIYDRMDKHALNAMQQDDSNKKFIGGAIGVGVVALVGGAVKFGPKIVKAMVKK
ncbi:hypothetical protein DFO70_102456 [Cytobacillus firmus]|uniref:Uncharacterized protein n=2 Tax=Cytobacillus TaxID=2675230 RepID=A0A366K2Z5_CYTFI|nr:MULTISPECIES: hypothetical protein [Cytobacillus]RBP96129.1 hypothetical protein DFO70_102456 [Cytobacillus firmus]TDX45042.1 hypothetical protein DFO72_103456 [Cytobacillus oceanisediminis]